METDAKTKAVVRFFLTRLQDNQLNQELLIVFLISIRELADQGSLTREIGDFIAHPIRDRGLALAHLSKLHIQTNGQLITNISVPGPLNADDLVGDLAALIEKLGFESSSLKDKAHEIVICYFGILHGSNLKVGPDLFWKLKVVPNWSSRAGVDFLTLVAQSNKGWCMPLFSSSVASTYLIANELIGNDATLWAERHAGKLRLTVID